MCEFVTNEWEKSKSEADIRASSVRRILECFLCEREKVFLCEREMRETLFSLSSLKKSTLSLFQHTLSREH